VPLTTSAQAASAASGAYTSLTQLGGAASFANGLPAVSGAPAFDVLAAARAADRVAPRLAAAQVAGATQSATDRCSVSGTISGSITAADTNYPFSHSGDSATITFSQCNEGTGEVMDGSISIRIDATVPGVDFLGGSPSQLQTNFAYAATLTFGDLTYANANGQWFGMDGNITLGLKQTTSPFYDVEQSVSGTGLGYAVGQGSQILEGSLLTGPNGNDQYLQKVVSRFSNGTFSVQQAELTTINGKVCSIAMGGCLSVVTVVPIYDATGANNPSDGTLVMTSGNAQLIFDVLSVTSVDIGFDANVADNAGTDPTPLTTIHATWACLQTNTCH
jgi:hypothetical protein